MQLIILLCLLLSSASARPQSNGEGSRSEDYGKCSVFEFQEFLADQVACMDDAGSDLSELINALDFSKEELRNAICDKARRRVGKLIAKTLFYVMIYS